MIELQSSRGCYRYFFKFVSTGPVECCSEVLYIKDLVINLTKLVTNRHMFLFLYFIIFFLVCLFVLIIANA